MLRKKRLWRNMMEISENTIIELLRNTSKLTMQVQMLNEQIDHLSNIATNDIKQDQLISNMAESLRRGNEKFKRIDDRLTALENEKNERARNILSIVWRYILTAIVGAIIANVGNIIAALK